VILSIPQSPRNNPFGIVKYYDLAYSTDLERECLALPLCTLYDYAWRVEHGPLAVRAPYRGHAGSPLKGLTLGIYRNVRYFVKNVDKESRISEFLPIFEGLLCMVYFGRMQKEGTGVIQEIAKDMIESVRFLGHRTEYRIPSDSVCIRCGRPERL